MDRLCGRHTPQEMLMKLECIQRRGTKFILGKWNLSYEERLKCLNLLSLEKRCYLFDVTFLYKALNGYLNVDVSPFLNFYSQDDRYRFRHVDDYSLKTNFARMTIFKRVYLGVRTCEVFLCFVTIMFVLSIVLTSLFSLFYVTREGNRFLHRG